jgi:hypothetical protein
MPQFETIPEDEQANMIGMYWQLMRDAEERAYESKRSLDRLLVERQYLLWNRVTGSNLLPRWVNTPISE